MNTLPHPRWLLSASLLIRKQTSIFVWHCTEKCVLDSVLISKEKGRKIEHFNI